MNQQAASADAEDARVVEVRARTVDEAVARGLVRLGGLSRSEVNIEVVSEGKGGLLGFGAEEAVVRLTVLTSAEAEAGRPPTGGRASSVSGADLGRSPGRAERSSARGATSAGRADAAPAGGDEAPPDEAKAPPAADVPPLRRRDRERADERPEADKAPPRAAERAAGAGHRVEEASDDLVRAAVELTERYLQLLGFSDAALERGAALLPAEVEEEPSLVLNVHGTDTKRLLAREGRPLLALQFLVRLALNRETGTWVNLLLDVDGDRARRVKELFHLAEQSAELVDRDGRPVSLPPMTPYERRVVHLALRDHPVVTTQSIGRADARKVTVRLKGQLLAGV